MSIFFCFFPRQKIQNCSLCLVECSYSCIMVFNGMLNFISWIVIVVQTVKLSTVFGTSWWAVIGRGWRFGRMCGQVMRPAVRWNRCWAIPSFMGRVVGVTGRFGMVNRRYWMVTIWFWRTMIGTVYAVGLQYHDLKLKKNHGVF